MRDRIVVVMSIVFGIKGTELPLNITLGQSDVWDSIRHLSLILALEEEFDVHFTIEQIVTMINIETIEQEVIRAISLADSKRQQ
jgi:acyl carrier protein